MPMSFVFEIYWQLRVWYSWFYKDPTAHQRRVLDVQEQVRKWKTEGEGKKMCTARPTWQTVSSKVGTYKKRMYPIRVVMQDILEVDTKRRTITVEPGVTMGQIYKFLIPKGWTLPVNPELDELTIGGLVNGYGIETSSHKYGLFCEVIRSCDIVLPSGELVHCSETENQRLFRCIPWSYGTLGFLVSVELDIIPAKPWVKLSYIPCTSLDTFVETFSKYEVMENCPEFLEGIMFTKDTGVVTVGEMVDNAEFMKINRTWWFKPYFYEQCREKLSNPSKVDYDYIPLKDYYQRHNRSIFWDLPDICPAVEWKLFRWIAGWMLPPRIQLIKWCQTDSLAKFYEENYALQDFLVPLENMKGIIEQCHEHLRVYPLWLCPMKVKNTGKYRSFMVPGNKSIPEGKFQYYVDAATVGPPGIPIKQFDMQKSISAIEDYMRQCGGYQGNYGYTYQNATQYRAMYNHELYDAVRKEIGADKAFPEPFDKVGRAGFQQFAQGKIEKKMN